MDGWHFDPAPASAPRLALRGRTALVTGSTSGIGLAIARALAEAGANVVTNGFGDVDGALLALAPVAARSGARLEHHGADLAVPSEIEAMMAHARSRFGAVDVLVNNAGVQHVAKVEAFPTERWDQLLAVNLSAAFHTTRLALPEMKARNFGRIVNVASVHGLVASAEKAAYVAAKHGLVGLTKVVALETARTNVTCNAICPGWVRTPLVERQIEARAAERGLDVAAASDALVSEKQPSGDFVSVDELAALVVFLVGEAGRQIRGAAWTMDGGWTAQ
jgi:3-hydroxybutyrate dehydrogenase